MMKPLLALLGVGAACAACCAIPLALPLIGGVVASGVLGVTAGWQWAALGAAALAAIAATAWRMRRRRPACTIDPTARASAGCRCELAGSSANAPSEETRRARHDTTTGT
ncbi:hypothetical protein M8A51_18020 [Schlegelella sp. S2-27]|uniref:Mercuric ion transport protein n=1 Tax=Caldimonas mangrovi TaxID=2944811 RepID=A0ABT0YRQ2_9BURK|nr:hypothetical protein [Caldimonas mangrovi]MCM5681428.1 hypothetical protein [Caldimonas mangrovi]